MKTAMIIIGDLILVGSFALLFGRFSHEIDVHADRLYRKWLEQQKKKDRDSDDDDHYDENKLGYC